MTTENSIFIRDFLKEKKPGIISIDEYGIMQSFDSTAEELFGYKQEDMLGKNVTILMPEPYRSEHDSYLRKYLLNKKPKIIGQEIREISCLRKNGDIFPSNLYITQNNKGDKINFTGYIHNIENIKKIQEVLFIIKESSYEDHGMDFLKSVASKTRELLDLDFVFIGEGNTETGTISTLTVVNREGFPDNFTYNLENTPCSTIFHKELCFYEKDVQKLFPKDKDLVKMRIESYMGIVLKNKQNEPIGIFVGLSQKALPDPKLKMELFKVISNRIATELAQKVTMQRLIDMKDIAEKSSKVKSEFLATVSHELRTPMNGIIGASGLLEESKLDENQIELVDIISSSANNLMKLINDILDLSKIESDKIEIIEHSFNIHSFVQDLLKTFQFTTKEKGIRLSSDIPEELLGTFIIGDSSRLRQVLVNLIGNAVKFTDEGEVYFKIYLLQQSERMVNLKFEIIDTGIGIREENHDMVFEQFSQVDQSHSREHPGTGLGLPICKKLVHLMNGEISFSSKPGVGSTFFIEMPFKKDTEVSVKIPSDKTETLAYKNIEERQNFKILLAEDNPINVKVIQKILAKANYSCDHATNGQKALLQFEKQPYDLVLMDIQMPVMNGIEATKKIREGDDSKSKVPIIAITANAMQSDRQACLESGVNCFLTKPINKIELLNTIDEILLEKF